MAKTSMKVKQQRKQKFSTRVHTLQHLWTSTLSFKEVRNL